MVRETTTNPRQGAPVKQQTGIDRAIQKAGSQQALADQVKVKQQSVSRWQACGVVPAKRVKAVAKATGVSKRALNPELF